MSTFNLVFLRNHRSATQETKIFLDLALYSQNRLYLMSNLVEVSVELTKKKYDLVFQRQVF